MNGILVRKYNECITAILASIRDDDRTIYGYPSEIREQGKRESRETRQLANLGDDFLQLQVQTADTIMLVCTR